MAKLDAQDLDMWVSANLDITLAEYHRNKLTEYYVKKYGLSNGDEIKLDGQIVRRKDE